MGIKDYIHYIANLFGASKNFFDKEATIKEYFAMVPENERPKAESFEELYLIALSHVGNGKAIEFGIDRIAVE